jgi:hypothetical protein
MENHHQAILHILSRNYYYLHWPVSVNLSVYDVITR